MTIERDDLSTRIIGTESRGLQFYDDDRDLRAEIYLQANGTLNIGGAAAGGGAAEADEGITDAMYLLLNAHDDLSNARVLVAGAGLRQIDGGAGNNHTLSVESGVGISAGVDGVAIDQSFAPTWTGAHAFQATITSQSIIPAATDQYDLGSGTRLWRKVYISELEAFIIAENTISLVGGYLVVPHDQGSLAADVITTDTTIDFGKTMTENDWVLMRAFGQVEYLTVGTVVSTTTYNVTRDVDGSGANDWPAGTAFLVLGQEGDGRIELNAAGPNLSVVVQGATYNATAEPVKLDDDGLTLSEGDDSNNKVKWVSSGSQILSIYSLDTAGSTDGYIYQYSHTASSLARLQLRAMAYGADAGVNIVLDSQGDAVADQSFRVEIDAENELDVSHDVVRVKSTLYINETANAFSTRGITINMGTADDHIFSLKSSDVAHGMTGLAETDTFAVFSKAQAAAGGLRIQGMSDADGSAGDALLLRGIVGEAADTTKSTSAIGAISLQAYVKSGTSATSAGADGNLVVIRNSGTTRYIFDAEGSAHADVEWTTFDEHDDVHVLDTLESTLLAWRDPVKAGFAQFLDENALDLERLGLVHFDREMPGHAMINTTRLSMLTVGAIRQMSERLRRMEEKCLN